MKTELEIVAENLSETQREIADQIGLENYIKLTKLINGDTIYIPKYSEIYKPCIDEKIREKFDGYNFKELAAEYDLAVKTIYNKLPPKLRVAKRNRPIDEQVTLY